MSAAASVKRTYGSSRSRSFRPSIPSSPVSDLRSSSPPPAQERENRPSRIAFKRPLETSISENTPAPDSKRLKLSPKSSLFSTTTKKIKAKPKTQTKLAQLHLVPDQPLLRACALCGLSYVKAAAEDETLHRAHCARVRRGMEWGKAEERELQTVGSEVASNLRLKDGLRGRIVCFRADSPKKIGSKLSSLLETINLNLSAPALTPLMLQRSKAYLFLTPGTVSVKASSTAITASNSSHRENIIACIIAEEIQTAMRIATPGEMSARDSTTNLVTVDCPSSTNSDKGLFAHPDPLPTPLGISRIFVASSQRRKGVGSTLLDSICRTFIHGYVLDPKRGEVAFTQPTGDGRALMLNWGGEDVRVYDESTIAS